jgi:hypothetical protein
LKKAQAGVVRMAGTATRGSRKAYVHETDAKKQAAVREAIETLGKLDGDAETA